MSGQGGDGVAVTVWASHSLSGEPSFDAAGEFAFGANKFEILRTSVLDLPHRFTDGRFFDQREQQTECCTSGPVDKERHPYLRLNSRSANRSPRLRDLPWLRAEEC